MKEMKENRAEKMIFFFRKLGEDVQVKNYTFKSASSLLTVLEITKTWLFLNVSCQRLKIRIYRYKLNKGIFSKQNRIYVFTLLEVVVGAFLIVSHFTLVLLKMHTTLHLNIPPLFLYHLAIVCPFPLFYKTEVGFNQENTGYYGNGSKDPNLYPLQIHIKSQFLIPEHD